MYDHDSPGRDAGSFRDPSGHVFWRHGKVYRALRDDCRAVLDSLPPESSLVALARDGLIVGTRQVGDEVLLQGLRAEHPGFSTFLEHDVVPTVTYPYEWCVSMLADAAMHTIDLQTRLAGAGFGLKDASAYNVQFARSLPVFIDVASIERPRRLDIWFALGQFGQMFTFPLLLARHHGWDLRSYFLGSLAGRTLEQVARSMGWLERLGPRALLHVTLPLLLTRWANKGDRARRETIDQPRLDPRAQLLNLRLLRSKIARLVAGYKPRGVWARYTETCTYDDAAEAAKKGLVREHLESTRPRRVLDLGCNTGDYSRIAAAGGAEVVAVDADHDAVEILYRRLRQDPASITPLVIDLSNPSPGVGFLNDERAPFLDRAQADCVLALALMHHLMVSGNLPMTGIVDMLHRLTRSHVILELVPPEDEMFRKLLKFRVDVYTGIDLEACRQALRRRFVILREVPIASTERTLLFLKRLDSPQ